MKVTILFFIICIMTLYPNDIYVDKENKLMWQDDSSVNNQKMDWYDANKFCLKLELQGYHNWRLPSIKELQKIVDISKSDPAIKRGFKNISSNPAYWSSTSNVIKRNYAWYVYFKFGLTHYYKKNKKYYVRCVRNIQKQ